MVIDIHSHIIPEIDDGATSWEECFEMCDLAWKDGVRTIVATPHAFNGVYGHEGQDITAEIKFLNEKLKERAIGLSVVAGAEVHSRPDIPELLEKDISLTLNSNGHYFLLEFPHTTIPPNVKNLIFQLTLKRFIPIIVHPERNTYLQNHLDEFESFVDQGAMCQVTAMSITGRFGKKAEEASLELLDRDLIHFIASDTHSIKARPPVLSEAYKKVTSLVGEEKAKEIFETNPDRAIKGLL